MGSASSSVRTSTVGPGPFLKIATTPVFPTFSVTWKPMALISAANLAAVRVS
jgi:hypothetical protein